MKMMGQFYWHNHRACHKTCYIHGFKSRKRGWNKLIRKREKNQWRRRDSNP